MNLLDILLEKKLFKENDKVGVALSGGADSVALLLILIEISKMLPMEVFAIHINHSIRQESLNEENFVKNLVDNLGVKCLFFTLDKNIYKESGAGLEEAARKGRYEVFERIAEQENALIALGHHKEDQAETVFMNLLRGAGLSGLSGMKERNGVYIRPLLDFSKAKLLEFLKEKNIGNITDNSNFDERFTRNKIRQNVFPYIDEQLNTDINLRLSGLANVLSADEAFLACFAKEKFAQVARLSEDKIILKISKFITLDKAIARRVLRLCVANFNPSLKDISFNSIEQIFELLSSENKSMNLPNNLIVKRVYDDLEFYLKVADEPLEEKLFTKTQFKEYFASNDSPFCVGDFELSLIDKDDLKENFDYFSKNPFKKCLDYGKFKDVIFIRTRQAGDFITIASGKKTLKKLFIDEKIREDERDKIYLLGSASNVAWMVGYRIGEYYKVNKDTKTVLIIEYKGDFNG